MKFHPRFLTWFAGLALLGCAAPQEKKDDKKPIVQPPKLVGRIASIPAERNFVLIQSYAKWDVPAGTVLTTRGPQDRAANLLATGETLGQYAAADIQSGSVEPGDAVYFRAVRPVETSAGSPSGETVPPSGDPVSLGSEGKENPKTN